MSQGGHRTAHPGILPPDWAKLMPSAPLLSSDTLGWESIALYRFRNPKRWQMHQPPLAWHFIAAHLLNPSKLSMRLNGRWQRGRTSPGEVIIMAAAHLFGDLMAQALALQLLRGHTHSTPHRTPGRSSLSRACLNRALEAIELNLSGGLSLAEVAGGGRYRGRDQPVPTVAWLQECDRCIAASVCHSAARRARQSDVAHHR